jgi:hypothetical protein
MAAKGESRTGLVVFLVLFILLSIGLGVTTYYGYDAADKAEKAKKTADDTAKRWEGEANYWECLALTYQADLGLPATNKDKLATLRSQYDKGGLQAPGDENKEDHKKYVADLDKTFQWDAQNQKPGKTVQDEFKRLTDAVAEAGKKAKDAEDHAAEMERLAESRKREKEAADANYKTELANLKKQNDDVRAAKDAEIVALQGKIDALGDVAKKNLGPLLQENDKVRKDQQRMASELASARKTITERGWELDRKRASEDIDVSKIAPENLATISNIFGDGEMPYISLGSGDNLKPQVTFSIYGKGVDGKPLKESKGKLEVVRIVGDHLAQARITEVRDRRRDPVLVGDFLFNPAWNPNLKQHVAIIGTIDLTGEGRDNLQEFINGLKRENVVVDAYMDMKTSPPKMVGEVTRQTDLLIVGAAPELTGVTVKEGDKKDLIFKKMQEVQNDAAKLGVRIVRLNAFLEMSGYTLPKPLEAGKIDFHRTLENVGSPIDRREPPKKPAGDMGKP